eukprot:UN06392
MDQYVEQCGVLRCAQHQYDEYHPPSCDCLHIPDHNGSLQHCLVANVPIPNVLNVIFVPIHWINLLHVSFKTSFVVYRA